MTKVVSAEYVGDYSIKVCFDDNKQGTANLWPIISTDERGILQQLKDKKLFSDFSIACNTVTWKNGVDISPDYLADLTTYH